MLATFKVNFVAYSNREVKNFEIIYYAENWKH